MRKLKLLLLAFALAAGALITGAPAQAGAATLTSSIDRWDNGKNYAMHWHLDTFNDGSQHINIDCYQGPWIWSSCLESWSTQQFENVVVYLGSPGAYPFKVTLESAWTPGYVTKNYPTSGSCCNPPQSGYTNPITYPGINNAYELVNIYGGYFQGSLLNLKQPFVWSTENTGSTKRVAFTES